MKALWAFLTRTQNIRQNCGESIAHGKGTTVGNRLPAWLGRTCALPTSTIATVVTMSNAQDEPQSRGPVSPDAHGDPGYPSCDMPRSERCRIRGNCGDRTMAPPSLSRASAGRCRASDRPELGRPRRLRASRASQSLVHGLLGPVAGKGQSRQRASSLVLAQEARLKARRVGGPSHVRR
jgi:hypothetical protein